MRAAQAQLVQERQKQVNLTDGDARLMKGRQGILPAYNAQAVVSQMGGQEGHRRGMLITAAQVVPRFAGFTRAPLAVTEV